jgi:hypothetical protein
MNPSAQTTIPHHFLIIGAMKCGTSSVFSYLKEHPEICASTNKEPEFFSERQLHRVDLKSYDELWPHYDATQHKYAMEASTGYTKFPIEQNVPQRIHDYGLQPKFLYIVRNPFERIISHYNFMRSRNPVPLDLKNPMYIKVSDYFMQLERFQQFFPDEDFLVLDFDDLKTDPRSLLDRIHQFLGISPGVYPESFAVVNKLKMESPSENVVRKVFSKRVLELAPDPLKRSARKLLRKLFPTKKRVLTDAEVGYIRNELKGNMAKLQAEYGIDVGKWGF